MQKIIIRNFGPIPSAEIEIRKYTVLIGEQSSGKSTVAKLIYFFKSQADLVFTQFYEAERMYFSLDEHLIFPARDEFSRLFGEPSQFPGMAITFYYNFVESKSLTLSLPDKSRLHVKASEHFRSEKFQAALRTHKANFVSANTATEQQELNTGRSTQLALQSERSRAIKGMAEAIDAVFESRQEECLYTVAGRESTVG